MATEPMGAVAEPARYFVATYAGIAALVLSFAVSIGISIHFLRRSSRNSAHRET